MTSTPVAGELRVQIEVPESSSVTIALFALLGFASVRAGALARHRV